ncbi:hypothetical protein TEGL_14070 [Terrisporobacter glycolicus ATCC 14880 = DSM 1288]|uniref:Uncharacterized protein n=1 Tax=Terrisporobacter glycolicus ATCC 14880 = DSM 1288 TaxID=1121315 RepID=A0ABZ2ETA8_9FIRM
MDKKLNDFLNNKSMSTKYINMKLINNKVHSIYVIKIN